jgi:hypothetical protein
LVPSGNIKTCWPWPPNCATVSPLFVYVIH